MKEASDQPIDPERLITDLRDLTRRAKSLGTDQQKILIVLRNAIERAKAILDTTPDDDE